MHNIVHLIKNKLIYVIHFKLSGFLSIYPLTLQNLSKIDFSYTNLIKSDAFDSFCYTIAHHKRSIMTFL